MRCIGANLYKYLSNMNIYKKYLCVDFEYYNS